MNNEGRIKETNDVFSNDSYDMKGDMIQETDLFLSQSDISSMNDSMAGTEGGYDEDVSEYEEDYEWLDDLNNKRPNLPNFWLIMQIDRDAVTIYFHCRYAIQNICLSSKQIKTLFLPSLSKIKIQPQQFRFSFLDFWNYQQHA